MSAKAQHQIDKLKGGKMTRVRLIMLISGGAIVLAAAGFLLAQQLGWLKLSADETAGIIEIKGDEQDNEITGTSGRDRINGEAGNDMIYGGEGDDKLNGGEGDDVIFGSEGDDTISGGEGNDTINGGAGNDTLLLPPGVTIVRIKCLPDGFQELTLSNGSTIKVKDVETIETRLPNGQIQSQALAPCTPEEAVNPNETKSESPAAEAEN